MVWPGERLIIRLWETLSEKGVGSLLKPWQIKREGIAHLEVRRVELLALAQTEKDAEDIRTGHKRLEDFSPDLTFAATAIAPLRTKARIEPTIDLPQLLKLLLVKPLKIPSDGRSTLLMPLRMRKRCCKTTLKSRRARILTMIGFTDGATMRVTYLRKLCSNCGERFLLES